MLAGYLPFDDDPANPEGDNINLLYKYIVNTPLTFPEYVTPHARDLLRRILVPNPRKRADLFEVARHSWLSEYAHVVEFITSSTTSPRDIQNTTVTAEDVGDAPVLARSSSVRESSKKTPVSPPIGGLVSKQGTIDADAEAAHAKQQRDNKRRTVQVEYVAPNTATQRGGEPSGAQPSSSRTRARAGSQGAVEVAEGGFSSSLDKPLPRDPPVAKDAYGKAVASSRRPPSAHRNPNSSAAAVRAGRDNKAVSETPFNSTMPGSSGARPPTGGSMQSAGSMGPGAGKRPSYSQPVPPELADTNAHGRIQQPARGGSSYGIPSSASQGQQNQEFGRPSLSVPPKFARLSGFGHGSEAVSAASGSQGSEFRGHKRSSTMGEISGKLFGRSGSLFGGRRKRAEQQPAAEKGKRYPPVSMNNAMPAAVDEPRTSIDSKRSRKSFSLGLGKKTSGSIAGSQNSQEKHNRRFSFIPASFSLRAIGLGKDEPALDSQQDLPIQEPPTVDQHGRYVDQDVGREDHVEASTLDGMYAQLHGPHAPPADPYGRHQQQYSSSGGGYGRTPALEAYMPSDVAIEHMRQHPAGSWPQLQQVAQQDGGGYDARRVAGGARQPGGGGGGGGRGVLQKNRRFVDAWDTDSYTRGQHDHSGSSGPARKVMDFFRRRGKARGGEIG